MKSAGGDSVPKSRAEKRARTEATERYNTLTDAQDAKEAKRELSCAGGSFFEKK